MLAFNSRTSAWLLPFSLMIAAPAFAADYSVDPAHSNVKFTIKHNMISTLEGSFSQFDGTYSFEEKKAADANVSFTIQAASVVTGNEKRDAHLKTADFFDTAKFPTITFVSKSIKAAGKDKYKLAGDMTMHGVTKTVTFDVTYNGSVKDMMGADRTGFSADGKINRKDFGIVWNKTLDKGNVMLSDDVTLLLQVEGVKKGAADAAKK